MSSTTNKIAEIRSKDLAIWVIDQIKIIPENETITSTRIQNTIFLVQEWIRENSNTEIKLPYEFKNDLVLGGKHDVNLQKDIEVWIITGLLHRVRQNNRNHITITRNFGESYLYDSEKRLYEKLKPMTNIGFIQELTVKIQEINEKTESRITDDVISKTKNSDILKLLQDKLPHHPLDTSKFKTIHFYALIPTLTRIPLTNLLNLVLDRYDCSIQESKNSLNRDNSRQEVPFNFKPEYLDKWEEAHGEKQLVTRMKKQLAQYEHNLTIFDSGLIEIKGEIDPHNEIEISNHYREICNFLFDVLREETILSIIANPKDKIDSGIFYYKSGIDLQKDINEIFLELEIEYIPKIQVEMHSVFTTAVQSMSKNIKKSGWSNLFGSVFKRKRPVHEFFEENVYAQTRINRTISNFLLLQKTIQRVSLHTNDPYMKLKINEQLIERINIEISSLFEFYKELGENFRTPTQILDTSLAIVGTSFTLLALGISLSSLGFVEIIKEYITSIEKGEFEIRFFSDNSLSLGFMIIGIIVSILSLNSLSATKPIKRIITVLRGISRTLNMDTDKD